jgi:hypothetical protein
MSRTTLLSSSVDALERRASALLAAEAERPVEEPAGEPLEAHRDLDQAASQLVRDTVDHAAADHGLDDRGVLRPLAAMLEQVRDGDCQIVVGIHQAR